jgi:hypothetical protein
MMPCVIINWIVQPHIDVIRSTSRSWQYRCSRRGKRDISDMARAAFQRWQERRSEGGKRDVIKVARAMFQRWKKRRS